MSSNVAERVFVKSFENFKGIDAQRSPLAEDLDTSSLVDNLRFNERMSLAARFGYQAIGQDQAGFVSCGNLYYLDPVSSATIEIPFAISREMFALAEGSFSINRLSGATDWDYSFGPRSDGTAYQFIIVQGGVTVATIAVNSTTTLDSLIQSINSVPGFSCGASPELKVARILAAQGPVRTVTVQVGHTFQSGDRIVFSSRDPAGAYLFGGLVTAATTTTISIRADYAHPFFVSSGQTLGPLGALASGIQFKGLAAVAPTLPVRTVRFPYWRWVDSATYEHAPYNSLYLGSLTNKSGWSPVSSASFNGRTIIGASTAGYPVATDYVRSYEPFPRSFDGDCSYRAGLPKGKINSVIDAGTGGLVASARYGYKIVYKHRLRNGDIVLSQPSEAIYKTLAAGNTALTLNYYHPRFASCFPDLGGIPSVLDSTGAPLGTTLTFNAKTPVDPISEVVFRDTNVSPNQWRRRAVTFQATTSLNIDGSAVVVPSSTGIFFNTFEGLNLRGGTLVAGGSSVTKAISTGHRFRAGDWLVTNSNALMGNENEVIVRRVLEATDVSVTIEGSEIDNTGLAQFASAGMSVEIYRTRAGGNLFYKVAERVIQSDSSTVASSHLPTYTDTSADSALGAQLIEPEIGKERDPPPAARLIAPHQGGVVYSGIQGEDNSVAWSAIEEGPEAVPLASNYTDITSDYSGPITAIASDQADSLLVFKPNAQYALSGDLNNGAFVSRIVSEGDYGIASQASIVRFRGTIVGVGSLGINAFTVGGVIPEFGAKVNSLLVNFPFVDISKAVSFQDPANKQIKICIPRLVSFTGSLVGKTSFAYDYERDAWFNWLPDGPTGNGDRLMTAGAFYYKGFLAWLSRAGYSTSLTPSGIAYYETHFGRYSTGTLPPAAWLYSDALRLSQAAFGSEWIHLGEPSVFKLFLKLKLWRFIQPPDGYSVSRPITYRVVCYRDFNDTSVWFTSSVAFPNTEVDFERIISLPAQKARAMRFEIYTDSNTTLNSLFLSGFELVVDMGAYQKTTFIKQQGAAVAGRPLPET